MSNSKLLTDILLHIMHEFNNHRICALYILDNVLWCPACCHTLWKCMHAHTYMHSLLTIFFPYISIFYIFPAYFFFPSTQPGDSTVYGQALNIDYYPPALYSLSFVYTEIRFCIIHAFCDLKHCMTWCKSDVCQVVGVFQQTSLLGAYPCIIYLYLVPTLLSLLSLCAHCYIPIWVHVLWFSVNIEKFLYLIHDICPVSIVLISVLLSLFLVLVFSSVYCLKKLFFLHLSNPLVFDFPSSLILCVCIQVHVCMYIL